jgi:GT2 family glycosyltransferase
VGAVAPRLLLPGGGTQHSVWAFPTVGAALVQSLGVRLAGRRLSERLVLRGAWDPERPRLVPWAIGAFLLVRRAAFTQVGGFDEAQWLGAEDLDLGWRLHQTGWRTYYEPAARVRHEESAATAQVWGEALPVQWQRAAYAWMVWRLGRPRTAAVGLVNFFGSATRLLGLAARRARGEPVPLRPDLRWTAVHVYALAPRRVLARHR